MVNGTCLDVHHVIDGIPHGGLVGLMLYLCYSNDMEIEVNCKLILYADDSIILVYTKMVSVFSVLH